ncbi:hypothetical protein LK231_1573 [Lactococcus lactis subsp. lactis]|nr:hypothetical protein LK231_1573 [Lactococcus lactis subsp. lactis]
MLTSFLADCYIQLFYYTKNPYFVNIFHIITSDLNKKTHLQEMS